MPNTLFQLNDWTQNAMCVFSLYNHSSPLGYKLTCLLHSVTRLFPCGHASDQMEMHPIRGAEGAQSVAVCSLGRKESCCGRLSVATDTAVELQAHLKLRCGQGHF